MDASREVVGRFGLAANQVWLWGQGFQPAMVPFAQRFGVRGGIVTAVDLVRGLGVLCEMDLPEVEGATAWYDTNYEGKRDAALEGLRAGADLFVIHVEATDEAGHAGNAAEKVAALENWDARILTDLVPALDEMGEWRLLLLPDHATPLDRRTHTSDPVPYLLVGSGIEPAGGAYTEAGVADRPVVAGHQLLPRLLA
jgi:2,3-bisphosphoglycerate-independent phosphoglycerate mutase